MKRIIIAVSMLAASMAANAQDPMTTTTTAPTGKLYKPVAGDVLAEIGLFASTGGITGGVTSLSESSFKQPQLKFRYFLQDQIAVRVGFNYTQNSNTSKINDVAGTATDKTMSSLFGLNLGLEKHFTGTGRLSTYAGGDLLFQTIGVSEERTNTADGTTFANGASSTYKGTNAAGTLNGSLGFGVRAVAGADYYFVDKVYLGAEFGWGFIASKNSKSTADITPAGGGLSTSTTNSSTGGSFNLAPSLTAGLRLGFRF
ncbi:hypothetical protein [uncultured Cytophaga sp.]|uniref:hypothetical protein n=1 Tax=uncultured Cytophaga sp. TaxID=160238 RepID=UPI0026263622|nr:hypothetical protein [uncultured Cytophaga sp.]